MIISNWSVKNRIVVVVFCVAVTVAGAIAYVSMPLEAFPDIEIPLIMVTTRYRGVAPLDVERSVTVKIEDELKGLSGIRNLKSSSSEGMSFIVVEFEPEIDMDEAFRKVKDRVDRAKGELPTDLDSDPDVTEISASDFPIVWIVLSGPVGLPRLKDIAEEYQADIEAIPGVIEAEISGGLEREIIVGVDLDRAVGYNLPITQVSSQIASENLSISGGAIRMGSGRYQLRVPGEFETPEEARKIVVAVIDNEPVYLDDVATVTDGFKDEMSRSRMDYRSAVTIGIKKRSGANVVEIVDEVDRILERRKDLLPGGVTAIKVNDLAKFVKWLVKDLENNLLSGFFLVLAVVFFAMGFRNAVLVSLSIPLSMLISFVVLNAMGVTLNMIVLFSLTLALGMLVDNAIVIIENIYRYLQAGVPRINAACRATAEVAWPIIGSSLTTIAAFAPLLFWPGIMGSVFRLLPVTLIVTLISVLLVALVVNPALAAIFMRRPDGAATLSAEDVEKAGESPTDASSGFLGRYAAALRWCLRHRWSVLAISAAVVVLSVEVWLLAVGLEKPAQLMSSVDPDRIYVQAEAPEGSGLEYNDAIIQEVEVRIRGEVAPDGTGPSDLADLTHVLARSSVEAGGIAFGPGSSAANLVTLEFRDMEGRERSSRETHADVRERMKGIPGAGISVIAEEKGPPTGQPINIEITGDDLEVLGRIATEIRKRITGIPHVYDVRDDYAVGVPTIRVRVDRKKAALVGLNTEAVGFALKVAFNGMQVSTFRQGGEDYDITVRLPEADRNTVDTLERFFIPTPHGQLVPLTTIAEIVYEGGYASISRKEQGRTVTVTGSVDQKIKPAYVAQEEAKAAIADLRGRKIGWMERAGLRLLRDTGLLRPLRALGVMRQPFVMPPGYDYKFTGQMEFQKEAEEFLSRAFLMAVFAIAIILVMIFNSVTQPFIIMTSVILSMGTAFLGLAVLKLPFIIIMSGLGMFSLAGVVVNNAIVLVDYTNKLRARGYALEEAVVAAGATRLRPVLLTAITTILGLVPLVTGIAFDFRGFRFASASESTQWWSPMAICVIFGLGIATFLTLVVVPCLYHLIESGKARFAPRGWLVGDPVNDLPCDEAPKPASGGDP
ncbi:MAG: efflux RND transporter permease subunit [Planctomycetota bacterium]